MRKTPSLLIAATFAVLTVAIWGYANRPTPEPAWPAKVQGFSFQPFQKHQDAIRGDLPTTEEIDRDLSVLQGKATAVRTYSALGSLGQVPELAARRGINVTIGAWLGADRDRNEREIERTIQLANQHKNVTRVIVGNEVVLRGDLPIGDLAAHLDRVRAATKQPVSTAEPWHVWLAHPELADHVDYIAVHMLPYWEGVDVETAVDYVVGKMQLLEKAFPGKPIVIGEVGWPSDGRTRESAVATQSNQALFLRRFLARANQAGYDVLPDGGLRPAVEGAVRGRGRRLLGRVRRGPRAEIRVPRPDRARAAVAGARGGVGDRRGGAAVAVLLPQRHAAQPRPQLPRDRRLRDGDAGRLDPVRHVAAVPDGHQRAGRRGAAGRHGRRDRGAAGRGPRMGRGELGDRASPAVPARGTCRRPTAEGLDPRAGLQRAARHADRDARRARTPRLPGLRSAGHRQQHEGRVRLATGAGALREARPALPLLPRGPAGRASRRARSTSRSTRRRRTPRSWP